MYGWRRRGARCEWNTRTCDDVEWSGGGLGLRLPAGKHRVRFAAPADELRASVASALQNTWRASSVPPAVAPGAEQ